MQQPKSTKVKSKFLLILVVLSAMLAVTSAVFFIYVFNDTKTPTTESSTNNADPTNEVNDSQTYEQVISLPYSYNNTDYVFTLQNNPTARYTYTISKNRITATIEENATLTIIALSESQDIDSVGIGCDVTSELVDNNIYRINLLEYTDIPMYLTDSYHIKSTEPQPDQPCYLFTFHDDELGSFTAHLEYPRDGITPETEQLVRDSADKLLMSYVIEDYTVTSTEANILLQQQCGEEGNKWEIAREFTPFCNSKTTDGGNNCTDDKQCEGFCDGPLSAEIGTQATGVCSEYIQMIGCSIVLQDGIVQEQLCL